jgi:hypothetical protein
MTTVVSVLTCDLSVKCAQELIWTSCQFQEGTASASVAEVGATRGRCGVAARLGERPPDTRARRPDPGQALNLQDLVSITKRVEVVGLAPG